MPPLEPGQTAEVKRVVTRELTADVLGNPGVTVLATPFVLTLLENAAHAVMAPHVPPGGATVGTRVDLKHLAATPLGMTVRAKADRSTVAWAANRAAMKTIPVAIAHSTMARAATSWRRKASTAASLIWSHSLSGWPSVTDSEVKNS